MMPRFGLQMVASAGLERLAWYGRGPAETYSDRKFEPVGLFSSSVTNEWVEYARPQGNGNKTDVRWVELTGPGGFGIRAEGMPLISVEAHHASAADIERAAYSFQMPRRNETFLNVDLVQMGVGGIDSWSRDAWPMEAYRIAGDRPHTYRFRLRPVAPAR